MNCFSPPLYLSVMNLGMYSEGLSYLLIFLLVSSDIQLMLRTLLTFCSEGNLLKGKIWSLSFLLTFSSICPVSKSLEPLSAYRDKTPLNIALPLACIFLRINVPISRLALSTVLGILASSESQSLISLKSEVNCESTAPEYAFENTDDQYQMESFL